ncbi:hypothetical protein LCGC14_3162580 [marine sediment metagenome]|uniref:Uncharacterized protein n=1 Tax=marine sediment metagenome TaxID=412755 RepID=A0A0F8VQX2_9ZZZZ
MRTSEAFHKGKKDGRAGKEPSPSGGKTAYLTGYQIGRSEWEQEKLIQELSNKGETP